MTCGPAQVLGLNMGTLKPWVSADITVIDPEKYGPLIKTNSTLKAKHTFDGWELKGKAVMTIVGGKTVYSDV